MLETELMTKPRLTRQPRDRRERHKHTSDRDAEHFNYVALFVVAYFMREHGFHLGLAELRDECVEQGDFSKSSESGEEGVGVARAFTAIHHVNATRGKTSAARQCKQPLAQPSFWQRRKFVEKRHDKRRRDKKQKQVKRD